MPPVLPLTAPGFTARRHPVQRPAVRLLPFGPITPDPTAEAGTRAPGDAGWCKGSLEKPTADCPPPQLQTPRAPLVGIARLAANSPLAETRRKSAEKPVYFLLPVKSILNRCDSKRVPFDWTINPYRGCEFGCKYCYARYTHEYMELDGSEFEKKIFVKQNAAPLLAQDVARVAREDGIAIGTATDPYQPAERRFEHTRSILEVFAKERGRHLGI